MHFPYDVPVSHSVPPGSRRYLTAGLINSRAPVSVKLYEQAPLTLAWMTQQLATIFGEVGLSQYLDIFLEQGFDTWETILDITESDLDALGVKLGHRRVCTLRASRLCRQYHGRLT